MPTTREVQAAKENRLRREQRYYTLDRRGAPCAVCRTPLDGRLSDLGEATHPCCDKEGLRP